MRTAAGVAMRGLERALTWPLRRPRWAAAGAAFLTLAALPFLLRLGVDNGLEVWLDRDAPEHAVYRELVESFGSEELILVIYRLPPLPPAGAETVLELLAALRRHLDALPGVRRVEDLSGIRERFFAGADADAFWRDVEVSPLYRNLLVSESGAVPGGGRLAATRVLLEPPEDGDRTGLVAAVREAAGGLPAGWDVRLAGPPVLNVALDRASRRASATFFPLVFALSALLLWLVFRRLAAVVVPFAAVGAGVTWTLGLMAATGHSLSMVTAALPPVVWVLGLSTSIHLLVAARRQRARGADRREAAALGVSELARPCLVSALTTALGFAALTFASMEPVRQMGVFGAFGVLACLAASFLLFPALASGLDLGKAGSAGTDRRRTGPRAVDRRLAEAWVERVLRRPRTVLAASAALALLFGVSLARLEADSNVVGFFRPGTRVAETYREVLPKLTGPYSLEVLLDTGSDPSAVELSRVEELAEALAGHRGVARVLSPLDLVKKLDQVVRGLPPSTFRLPDRDGDLDTAWGLTGSLLAGELRELFDPERGVMRLSVLARPMGSADHRRLAEALQAELATAPPGWNPRLTGVVDLLVGMQERLLTSQIRSFAAAFLWITPVLALLLGSVRYAVLSLAPNLFPVVAALGTLGLTGRPLDPATLMVAGVAFGIAVDDTIHVLTAYRRMRRRRKAPSRKHRGRAAVADALIGALERVGRPVVLTSAIAGLGFAVLVFSDFTPLLRFGLLTVLTLTAALFGDLVLLPALLAVADRSRKGEPAPEPEGPSAPSPTREPSSIPELTEDLPTEVCS